MIRLFGVVLVVTLAVPLASALPGATTRVTLRVQGQGIVAVGTKSVHCISASATQIVCTANFTVTPGRYVGLRERPKGGWTFSTWSGACRGSSSTCRIRVGRPQRVGATFLLRRASVPSGPRSPATSGRSRAE